MSWYLRSLALVCLLCAQGARADAGLLAVARTAAEARGATGEVLFVREGAMRGPHAERARVDVPAGRCVVAVLALASGEAQLRLRGASDIRFADVDSGPVAGVRYCAEGQADKLRLSAYGGGDFALGVFAAGSLPASALAQGAEPSLAPGQPALDIASAPVEGPPAAVHPDAGGVALSAAARAPAGPGAGEPPRAPAVPPAGGAGRPTVAAAPPSTQPPPAARVAPSTPSSPGVPSTSAASAAPVSPPRATFGTSPPAKPVLASAAPVSPSGPSPAQAALASTAGATQPPASGQPAGNAPPQETLAARLTRLAARAAPSEAAMAPARDEDLSAGDPRKREIVLEAGRCYRVVAVADRGAGTVGVALTSDAAPDAFAAEVASELLCPATTGIHTLRIVVTGSGQVRWQLLGRDDVATGFTVGGQGDDLLARRLRSEVARSDAGARPVSDAARGTLQTAAELSVEFVADDARCFVAHAVGVPSVRALQVGLYDQRGNLVAFQLEQGSVARVRACASVPGTWRANVRAFKGYGTVALQVYEAP